MRTTQWVMIAMLIVLLPFNIEAALSGNGFGIGAICATFFALGWSLALEVASRVISEN